MNRIRRIGLCLDIDGVFLRGKQVLPRAPETIQLLNKYCIPYVFVTNGGGITESDKIRDLEAKLACNLNQSQIIMCHTPYRYLVDKYRDDNILILGSSSCVGVMQSYGFNNIIAVKDIIANNPSIYPFTRSDLISYNTSNRFNIDLKSIKAAFIVHDPIDWAIDMQILADVIIENGRTSINGITNQNIPLFACNADLVYTTEYRNPRFTQGSFITAFKHLFETYTRSNLDITFYGKPYATQYRVVEDLLNEQAKIMNVELPSIFYGIGDNPVSDIRGANNAGVNWKSVLVKTGIFNGQHDNDANDPADEVFDDIYDAVSALINRHANS